MLPSDFMDSDTEVQRRKVTHQRPPRQDVGHLCGSHRVSGSRKGGLRGAGPSSELGGGGAAKAIPKVTGPVFPLIFGVLAHSCGTWLGEPEISKAGWRLRQELTLQL